MRQNRNEFYGIKLLNFIMEKLRNSQFIRINNSPDIVIHIFVFPSSGKSPASPGPPPRPQWSQDCNRTVQLVPGSVSTVLSSPLYPLSYPSRTRCTTTITAPTNAVIDITFSAFHLEDHPR